MADNKTWLVDREILKKEIFKWRFLFAVLAFVVLLFLADGHDLKSGLKNITHEKRIARISFDDVIYDQDYNLDLLDEIRDDDSMVALIVSLDSPGSTTTAGEAVYNKIRHISEKKPVVSIMNSVAASGAYLISVASDRIFAKNGTITGSIGVIFQAYEFSELAHKVGLNLVTIKSSPLKGGITPYEKPSAELIASTQQLVNDSYKQISDIVVTRRKFSKEQFALVNDGRVYLGDRALKLGLIDEIGDTKEALAWLKSAKKVNSELPIIDVDLKYAEDKWQKYFSRITGINLTKHNGPKLLAIME